MKRIGISTRPNDDRVNRLATELMVWLRDIDKKVFCIDLDAHASPETVAGQVDLMVILGGDGTLLHTARHFIGTDIPILGINLGRLGFLTETPEGGMFDAISDILAGKGVIEQRFGLKATHFRDGKILATSLAVNDVVIQRSAYPRPIEFEMQVASQFVFRLRADGLVLATPAGSTAYALSAGGPIVHPQISAISVVPVCPHTLSNRPVVVPADETIDIIITDSPESVNATLDGQQKMTLLEGDRVCVEKAGMLSLIYLPGRNYYGVLRSKLGWAGHAD
ncbi:MAG: NAD(+)/NADH kinase [Mariprofundaceae bacterium]